MKIALDLDGVVYDFVGAMRSWFKSQPDVADPERFDEPALCWDFPVESWGVSMEEFKAAMHEANVTGELWHKGELVDPGWPNVIRALRNTGHTVHVVTDRRTPQAQAATEAWLAEHGIEVDSIHFTSDKTLVNADVLIDDRYENLEAWLQQGKTAVCWQQPWNRDLWTEDRDGLRFIGSATGAFNTLGLIEEHEAQFAENVHQAAHAAATETILEEAQRLVHGDRGADYGHPIHDFRRTAKMITGVLLDKLMPDVEVEARDIPLIMNCVKMSREVNHPKRDNRVDGCGYWETLDMIDQYEAEDAQFEAQLRETVADIAEQYHR